MSNKGTQIEYHFTNVKHQYIAAVVGNNAEVIELNANY